nr:hypothetical protein [Tanacetum cinerariifolium]
MVAYLSKSDASEGFNQIIDFVNGSSIKYALTVNPNIYVSCIKQFWTTVVVKQVNDITSPTKFYMYPRFLQLMIRKQVGDLSTHTTKYISPALTQKVFANIRRVGKGFSGVETPLFESMLVEQQVTEEGDVDENVKEINAGDAAEGDVSAAHGEVPTVQPTPPQSPQVQPPSPQPQPQPDAGFPMNLLQEVMDTYAVLNRRVEHLEFEKVAQDLEITKLKKRVKKLERRNKVKELKLRSGCCADVVLKDDKDVADKAKEEDETEPAEVQKVVDVVTTTKLITEVVTAASETITAASAIITVAEAQVHTATTDVTLTTAPARVAAAPSRRRKGVVIRDPREESTTSTIFLAETKSKDKGKGILTKEQIEEDKNKALKRLNETLAERAAKRQKLDEEVEELKRHLQIVPNEDDDVYT